LVWTFWSTFDTVRVSFPGTTGFDTNLPQNYESTWQGRLGVEYQLRETWALRVGYAYDHGPQPTTTVSPFLHDSNRHAFGGGATAAGGAGYRTSAPGDRRGTSRYGYDGIYESSGFQVGAAIGFRF